MPAFRCKTCGGILVPVEGEHGKGVCDSCGNVDTIPDITDERRTDIYNRGNSFRQDFRFDEALEQYSQIVKEDPTDAEAHFCMMLCRYGINYHRDSRNGKFIPTCDRLSDCPVSRDPDYQAAIQYAKGGNRTIYQQRAEHIEKIRLGMMKMAAQAESYDVFICYKDTDDKTSQRTPDSYAAQDIYMFLKSKGYRVFFSRVTLKQEHLGEEWEPVIYAALNTARVMLVVGTRRDYMESPWVKNEWTRFKAIRRKDMTKALITCYQDMSDKEIPEELKVLEAHNIKDRDGTFYKDLEFAVDAHCGKKKAATKEQQVSADNYAMRAFQYIEDGDWARADQMLEQALNLDPENGEAHMGKLLVERECRNEQELAQEEEPLSQSGSYARILRYGNAQRQEQVLAIEAGIQAAIQEEMNRQALEEARKDLSEADSSNDATMVIEALTKLGDYGDAPALLERAKQTHQRLLDKEKREAQEEAERLAWEAERLEKEAADRAAAKKAQAEADAKRAKKARAKQRRKRIRHWLIFLIIVGVILYKVVGEDIKADYVTYQAAEAAMEAGEYETAAIYYYKASESIAARFLMKDAEEKGTEALTLWLGMEPVVTTTEERPWLSVDEEGGLHFDAGQYVEEDNFVLPTVLDGTLVTGFGSGCFEGVSGLQSLYAPPNYTWVGQEAFADCTSLSTIELGCYTTYIGESAFYNCDSLTSITIPDTVETIAASAFNECSYLTTCYLNEGLVTIGENAFANCSVLGSITIPGTVESIGENAFYNSGITSLTLEDGLTAIGDSAFTGCDSLLSVTIPGSVSTVGVNAFSDDDALMAVVISSGVSQICDGAFYDCNALTTLTIEEGVTSIGANAFQYCPISGALTLPASLTYIGESAFENCDALYEVYTLDGESLEIGNSAFYGCDTFNGAYLGTGITSIGDSAFADCSSMIWVTLSEGLTSIGTNCFANTCVSVIALPSTLTTLGSGAFYNDDSLQGIQIPDGVTVIEEDTFNDCSAMTWVWFGGNMSIVRDDAFAYCDALAGVYFSGNQEQWNQIAWGGSNDAISNASIYLDYYG